MTKIELTPAEVKVVKLICKQQTAKEIAEKLGFSHRTIEGTIQMIYKKTKVKNMVRLVIFAIKNDITAASTVKGSGKRIELKPNEEKIIKLICKGMINREIADVMRKSPRTIEDQREVILKKVKARNSIGLVLYAVKHGLVKI